VAFDFDAEYAAYVEVYEQGGYTAAVPHAERILKFASKWWRRARTHVVIANMRYTLARAAQDGGDIEAAFAHVAEGMKAAKYASLAGDPRISYEGLMLLLTRGELEMHAGDADAALDTFHLASQLENSSDHPHWFEAQTHLLLARQWALQIAGRFDESEQAANEALALASKHEPRLVPTALQRLSMIRRLTGADGDAQLDAAGAIQQTQDTRPADRAEFARHRASVALEKGDLDAAEHYLAQADGSFREAGDLRSASGTSVGRADIARQRGDLVEAIALAREAIEETRAYGETVGYLEAHTVLAMALSAAGRNADALRALDDVRAELSGERLDLIRVDVHRTVFAFNLGVERGAAGDEIGRDEAFALSASISVPAAFAADAVRLRMPPSEVRERWTREVALPVADTALMALTALGRADEIVDLLEHIAAGASLDPATDGDDGLEETIGAAPEVRLAPPPRVRSVPAAPGAIWWAIDAASERYDISVRAEEAVDAW